MKNKKLFCIALTILLVNLISGCTDLQSVYNENTQQTSIARNIKKADTLQDIFEPLSQYPELPTGCEVTSLAMVLNYYGLNADKCDISDNYLMKGAVGTVDFNEYFVGEPRDSDSFGCYAPVIVDTANRYLQANKSNRQATELFCMELESLYTYVDKLQPVIIWGTQDCEQSSCVESWIVNGKKLFWISPEHCMVLVGYDEKYVYVADPKYGAICPYEVNAFKAGYDALGKQAVIIE